MQKDLVTSIPKYIFSEVHQGLFSHQKQDIVTDGPFLVSNQTQDFMFLAFAEICQKKQPPSTFFSPTSRLEIPDYVLAYDSTCRKSMPVLDSIVSTWFPWGVQAMASVATVHTPGAPSFNGCRLWSSDMAYMGTSWHNTFIVAIAVDLPPSIFGVDVFNSRKYPNFRKHTNVEKQPTNLRRSKC